MSYRSGHYSEYPHSVSLRDFKGRNLVLFFYPRADTPGCTKEALGFSRLVGGVA